MAAEDEEKRCRLCWGDAVDGPLVQPCACRGSAKWIHHRCLERWRRTSPKADAAYRCGQCGDHYRDALSLELLSARLQAQRTSGQRMGFALNLLAWELQEQGKYDEAEPLCRESMEVARETLGYRHQNTLISIGNLGRLLYLRGDLAAAEPLYREALEGQREILGNRDPDTLGSIYNLGELLRKKGDLAAAEPLLRDSLAGRRNTLGNRHPLTLSSYNALGQLLQAKAHLQAAEMLYREALALRRETLGSLHPNTLRTVKCLGRLLKAKGDTEAAESLLREAKQAKHAGPTA